MLCDVCWVRIPLSQLLRAQGLTPYAIVACRNCAKEVSVSELVHPALVGPYQLAHFAGGRNL